MGEDSDFTQLGSSVYLAMVGRQVTMPATYLAMLLESS